MVDYLLHSYNSRQVSHRTRSKTMAAQEPVEVEEVEVSPVKVAKGPGCSVEKLPSKGKRGRRVGSKNKKNFVVLAPPDLSPEQIEDL